MNPSVACGVLTLSICEAACIPSAVECRPSRASAQMLCMPSRHQWAKRVELSTLTLLQLSKTVLPGHGRLHGMDGTLQYLSWEPNKGSLQISGHPHART